MFCAISGVTPEDPVVSVKSGLLYERRLIEKAIEDTGLCPVTGESLSVEDLVTVKSNKAVKPRPLQATSIPGMLTIFQNEWDALALRDYALEQQLNTAREELSHALYQSDAACRVIARLIRERDEARQLLAQAERQLAQGGYSTSEPAAAPQQPLANGKRAMETKEGEEEGEKQKLKKARQQEGISEGIINEMTACNVELSSKRKKREISENLATAQQIEEYTQLSSHPLHKTTKPGILSLDILGDQGLIVTVGMDGSAVVFNKDKGEIVASLTGHTKRVTAVKFVPHSAVVLSASADKTTRVWRSVEGEEGYKCEHVLGDHSAEVKAVTVHATNKYFVTASSDKTWCFYDLESGACLKQVTDPTVTEPYSAASFHPDGLILGTGGLDAAVRIWDIKSQATVAKFEAHTGAISSINFSENGYFLATAASDGVRMWDLRKLKNFKDYPTEPPQGTINTVRFDFSGSYLATGGSEVRIYQVGTVRTEWPVVKTFPDLSGTGKITCVGFGPDAKYVAMGTMDRNLRVFGLPDGGGASAMDDAA